MANFSFSRFALAVGRYYTAKNAIYSIRLSSKSFVKSVGFLCPVGISSPSNDLWPIVNSQLLYWSFFITTNILLSNHQTVIE